MKRIILHWTGGGYTPNGLDLSHYHFVIDGAGKVHEGKFKVSDNLAPLVRGGYAAHTLNLNTDSIGVALACMAGANERPFNKGSAPMLPVQVEAMIALAAELCMKYNIQVTRDTVLSHAEVQPTLGVKQKGKWDITWLPGSGGAGDPVGTGDVLRAKIAMKLHNTSRVTPPPPAKKPGGIIAWLLSIIFGGKK